MTRTTIVIATAHAFAAMLPAAPAQAQRDRVFVASYGSDGNPCTFGSPCKTFQQAVDVVAQGGEVTAIDSAGFGTVTISHAVTITSPAGVEAGIAAPTFEGNSITINAGPSDIIHLSGLTLDGDGVVNSAGIVFSGGGNLTIENCVIRNFYDGIDFRPTSSTVIQFFVSNTLISDNTGAGISINPSGSGPTTGVFDHVTIQNNGGVALILTEATQAIYTVSDSVIANNNTAGIDVNSGSNALLDVMVRNSTITNNGQYGLQATHSGAKILVTRSTISENALGWVSANGGVVTSFGDNVIVGNGGNTGSLSSAAYQ